MIVMRYLKYFLFSLFALAILLPFHSRGATLAQDQVTIVKATVLEVLSQTQETFPGAQIQTPTQSLEVEIMEGADKGKVVTFNNDYVILKKGDTFYLSYTV